MRWLIVRQAVAHLTKGVSPNFAKPPLNFNDGLTILGLTSSVKHVQIKKKSKLHDDQGVHFGSDQLDWKSFHDETIINRVGQNQNEH